MALTTEQQEQYIAIWAKAVDTQMHFNEMSVKSRQLGLTFVAAALGVAVVLMTRGTDYVLKVPTTEPWFQIHISVILVLAAALGLWAVKTLDLNVYHRMLRGAVTFGEDFEEHYMKQIFSLDKGMTQVISHFSRYDDAGKSRDLETNRYHYTGAKEVTAEKKIKRFYAAAFWFLFGSAVVVFSLTNLGLWRGVPNDQSGAVSAMEIHPPASGPLNSAGISLQQNEPPPISSSAQIP